NFEEYRFSKYDLMILFISSVSVMSPFSFLILLIRISLSVIWDFSHILFDALYQVHEDVFKFVYMVDYIDGFSYVEPSLYPWDEAYLIMVDDFSDMFLDSVRQLSILLSILASMFMRDIGL
ncbi:hypothetical protein H671_5g13852, partial [Cricetulus griseus]